MMIINYATINHYQPLLHHYLIYDDIYFWLDICVLCPRTLRDSPRLSRLARPRHFQTVQEQMLKLRLSAWPIGKRCVAATHIQITLIVKNQHQIIMVNSG